MNIEYYFNNFIYFYAYYLPNTLTSDLINVTNVKFCKECKKYANLN